MHECIMYPHLILNTLFLGFCCIFIIVYDLSNSAALSHVAIDNLSMACPPLLDVNLPKAKVTRPLCPIARRLDHSLFLSILFQVSLLCHFHLALPPSHSDGRTDDVTMNQRLPLNEPICFTPT